MDNSENPFLVEQQRYQQEREQQGIGHLSPIAGVAIKREVDRRIAVDNVIDAAEKKRIFSEVEKQYVKANGHFVTYGYASRKIRETEEEEKEQEDPNADYRRGYEHTMQREKEWQEERTTPYYQGARAARDEISCQRAAERSLESSELSSKWSEAREDLAEVNRITQLEATIKDLDERLKKLEKYTQE